MGIDSCTPKKVYKFGLWLLYCIHHRKNSSTVINFFAYRIFCRSLSHLINPVAKFIDLWLGDKVNSSIGLSYRHERLHGWRAGRYKNPMSELTLSPSQGSMNPAIVLYSLCIWALAWHYYILKIGIIIKNNKNKFSKGNVNYFLGKV